MITGRLESSPSTTNEIGIITNYYGGGDDNVLGNHVRSSELITWQNSDFVFSRGGGLHGPVGYGVMGGVFDHDALIKNVHPLTDVSYTGPGATSFAPSVRPPNDMSCAHYGINSVALDFHPQNDTSFTDHGTTSAAWNVHPHNGTSYADYGTISGAVGLLGNRIQGDAGFCLSGYDLLGGLKSEIQ
ncbi:hypothetical protein PanWU01x14_144000 [Parasponia andersonii]|uniref:Uncharacterized protein n=1 Tax=Parasponia andersonii TaxID=3476 RepID=A0A2P5CL24_PARAD|nr:hypothetical protein PanWU01x14_144000 [Parasponia andersonii]